MPLVLTVTTAILSLIAYTLTTANPRPVLYVQVTAAALAPAIFPFLSRITGKPFPVIINALIAVHIVLASNLGSALSFYDRFACWDLLMHGYFGFIGGVTLYALLLKWNGAALHRGGFLLLIFLGTMGCAAVWEMFEYVCDTLLGGDAQRVQEALTLGISPIKDTMTDILITAVGLLLFYGGLFIDKLCGYTISRQLQVQLTVSTEENGQPHEDCQPEWQAVNGCGDGGEELSFLK